MNLIQFLFGLLQAHVLIPAGQFAQLEAEGSRWYKSAGTNDEDPEFLKLGKKYADQWYVQVALAILFIFANKWVSDFMSADAFEEEEEEEE